MQQLVEGLGDIQVEDVHKAGSPCNLGSSNEVGTVQVIQNLVPNDAVSQFVPFLKMWHSIQPFNFLPRLDGQLSLIHMLVDDGQETSLRLSLMRLSLTLQPTQVKYRGLWFVGSLFLPVLCRHSGYCLPFTCGCKVLGGGFYLVEQERDPYSTVCLFPTGSSLFQHHHCHYHVYFNFY